MVAWPNPTEFIVSIFSPICISRLRLNGKQLGVLRKWYLFSSSRKRIYIYQIPTVLVRSILIDRLFPVALCAIILIFVLSFPRIEHCGNGVGGLEGGMMRFIYCLLPVFLDKFDIGRGQSTHHSFILMVASTE